MSEIQDYVFEDIEGISYFSARMPAFAGSDSYYSSTSDDGISDGRMAIAERDDGRTTTLEGTSIAIKDSTPFIKLIVRFNIVKVNKEYFLSFSLDSMQ